MLKIQYRFLSKVLSTQDVLQIHFNCEVQHDIIFDQPYFHRFFGMCKDLNFIKKNKFEALSRLSASAVKQYFSRKYDAIH